MFSYLDNNNKNFGASYVILSSPVLATLGQLIEKNDADVDAEVCRRNCQCCRSLDYQHLACLMSVVEGRGVGIGCGIGVGQDLNWSQLVLVLVLVLGKVSI